MKQGWITSSNGSRKHYVDDKIHSINDEPAIIDANGDKFWFHNNECHRDNGLPAIIFPDGIKLFYENDERLWECNCGEFAMIHCPTRRIKE